MVNGAQIWTLTKQIITKLEITQCAMEKSMITLTDKKIKKWFRHRTKVTEVVKRATHLKWDYAGHIGGAQDNR